MPAFTVAHAANVIVRALIPIVGVALFGWSGTKLLVVYFADTLASLYALMMLTLYATGTDDGRSAKDGTLGKLRTGIRVAVTPLPFVLVLGFFFGVLPLFVMLDLQEVAWREVLVDRGMWISVACQFAGALTLLLNQLDWVRTVDDPRRFFKHQLGLLAVRWGAMILVGFFLSRFIPRPIYGWLLIVTYAVATAALELAPGPVLAMVARWIGAGDPPRGKRPRMQEKSRTAVDPPPANLETGRRPSWLLLLFGAAFAVFGGIGIWSEADVTLRGVRATAKVIEVQGGIGKTKSVAANVEVAIPGQQRFRTEVHDTLGTGSWTEGGSVDVVCAKLTTSFPNCELDSMLDRWLFPVLLFALGAAALWGALRRRGPESMAPKR